MRTLLCFLILLLVFTGIPAQQFTEPDSAAVVRNHVKEIRINYINEKGNSFPTRIYRYNRNGQLVYSSEGDASYYYSYRYDSAGRMCRQDQRQKDGKLIAGYAFTYYPDGKRRYISYYSDRDSLHPNQVNTMDAKGNIVECRYYTGTKLRQRICITFNDLKQPVSSYDSSATQIVKREGNQLRFWIITDTVTHTSTSWYFIYGENGELTGTVKQAAGHTDTTSIVYKEDGSYAVMVNSKPATYAQDQEWRNLWSFLLPLKLKDRDYELPYSDPVPEMTYRHELKKDKKGNITEDHITGAAEWMHQEPVTYVYEYSFW